MAVCVCMAVCVYMAVCVHVQTHLPSSSLGGFLLFAEENAESALFSQNGLSPKLPVARSETAAVNDFQGHSTAASR